MPDDHVYTVSEIQNEVRAALEDDYGSLWVEGEVSDFRQPRQGHLYFTLKDERAQLAAIMWQSSARRLKFDLENGLAVRARGNLTVYPAFGKYQMIVQRLEPVGAGPLQVAFEQLRRRLDEEGLFDPAHKKALPAFPRRIALVTSPTGA
ncbi:MAG: exodeoxyribonuclease VII large subunit, partial [Planctomycetota bacterium]|nr:exodeoxyribonuclease VII large subunit [Planctomycetota bacterium]